MVEISALFFMLLIVDAAGQLHC
eukprot:COSAG05_NODE_20770_length_277_cov_0.573034_1_plen_22_part_10